MAISSRPARARSTLRIFLGSTSMDLEKHRDAVRHVVDLFDERPVVMGDFGARDGDAIEVSLERLRSCDVYVLLLGWRYGTIPANETLSVTHLEYRAAKDAGMPRLIFLSDGSTEADDGPTALFPAAVRDTDHATQLRAFRDEVGHDRVAAFFTTPDNAASLVAAALHHIIPTIQRPPNNLAPRAPGFVGRGTELQQLCQRLRSGQSVGLSALVAGMGGVGKSALAAEALATLAGEPDAFPGGVTWARCDGREGHDGLAWLYDQLLADWGSPLAPEQLAQAQVAGREAEVELRERALRNRLRASTPAGQPLPPALVLLDNVEVGLPLTRALDTLMSLGITALATARHQPSVARLAVVRLDVLDPTAAAQLFAERYREKGGAWDEARDSDAAAIVEQLGWLPLAIELQAARAALRQVSVAQLSSDLTRDRSQGLLGDPLDATRNLRYSFEQSLRTLTPLQRTRFAALGLPAGPDWPRPVIERLFAGIQENGATEAPDEEPSASELASTQADLDLLAALSLLNPAGGRIRLHPLLREFAHEHWREHAEYARTRGLKALLKGIQQFVVAHSTDYLLLSAEERMIVGAITQSLPPYDTPPSTLAILIELWGYFNEGGHWQLGEQLLQQTLETEYVLKERQRLGRILGQLGQLAHSLGQIELAQQYYEQALTITRDLGDRQGEGAILYGLGYVAYTLGQMQQAQRYFEQSLAIAREVNDREDVGDTLNALGSIAHSLGQPERAKNYYEQSLAIAREDNDQKGIGSRLHNLGQLLTDLGQLDQARASFEQSLAIFRSVGYREGEGATLNSLGKVTHSLGQHEQARAFYEQALAIEREIGARDGEGTTLNNLGELARGLGQKEQAKTYFEQALSVLREVGFRHGEGATLNNLGNLADSLGLPEQAQGYYEQALAIEREIGDRSGEGTTLNNLGLIAYKLGKNEQARDYYEQALIVHREVGNRAMEGTTLNNLGALSSYLEQMAEARHYFEQALEIAREVGNRSVEGATLTNLGEMAYYLGQKEEARACFEDALAIFQDIGDIDHVRVATVSLAYLDIFDTSTEVTLDDEPAFRVQSIDQFVGQLPATKDTSDAEPVASQEKAPQPKRKRRWPWSR